MASALVSSCHASSSAGGNAAFSTLAVFGLVGTCRSALIGAETKIIGPSKGVRIVSGMMDIVTRSSFELSSAPGNFVGDVLSTVISVKKEAQHMELCVVGTVQQEVTSVMAFYGFGKMRMIS